ALLNLRPDKATVDRVAAVRATRARASAMQKELNDLSELDQACGSLYRDAYARFQSNHDGAAFAATIEQEIDKPWTKARQTLARFDAGPSRRALVDQLRRYMAARGDAWRLMASGLRSHNPAVLKQAAAKQAEASSLLKQLNTPAP